MIQIQVNIGYNQSDISSMHSHLEDRQFLGIQRPNAEENMCYMCPPDMVSNHMIERSGMNKYPVSYNSIKGQVHKSLNKILPWDGILNIYNQPYLHLIAGFY